APCPRRRGAGDAGGARRDDALEDPLARPPAPGARPLVRGRRARASDVPLPLEARRVAAAGGGAARRGRSAAADRRAVHGPAASASAARRAAWSRAARARPEAELTRATTARSS